MFTLIAYAETVEHAAAASGGIGALGLDLQALLFQILNFAILLGLLRYFAYKPLLKVLSERQAKINEGLTTAEKLTQERAALAEETKKVLTKAREDAADLLQQTKQQVKRLRAEAETAGQAQQQQLLQEGRAQIAHDVEFAKRELKQEMVSLVALATEQMIDVKLDPKKDTALIEQRLESLVKTARN